MVIKQLKSFTIVAGPGSLGKASDQLYPTIISSFSYSDGLIICRAPYTQVTLGEMTELSIDPSSENRH